MKISHRLGLMVAALGISAMAQAEARAPESLPENSRCTISDYLGDARLDAVREAYRDCRRTGNGCRWAEARGLDTLKIDSIDQGVGPLVFELYPAVDGTQDLTARNPDDTRVKDPALTGYGIPSQLPTGQPMYLRAVLDAFLLEPASKPLPWGCAWWGELW